MKWILPAAFLVACLAIPSRAADPLSYTLHADTVTKPVDKRIYGQFLEHIFNSVHGGLWGDQILNGTMELRPANGRGAGGPGTEDNVSTVAGVPRYWEFVDGADQVAMDRASPFNAEVSVHIVAKLGADSFTGPGIRQNNIALKEGERYTLTFFARGTGSVVATFQEGVTPLYEKPFTGLTGEWQKFTVEFTVPRTVDAASLTLSAMPVSAVNIDQVSLFSASALATGGYRPDLLKAVADLQPATIRWPGGSFANKYIWQNGIGPREKRLPHPAEQWNDRDPYQFGTDEFLQLCEKLHAEPILVLNTARGVDDALHWLEYCMGDAGTEYGRQRAANGHPAPYKLGTIEIDNETWLLMQYPQYVDIVNAFAPAIRAKFPGLTLSVCGSYAYDTGPGEGNQAANRNWDPRLLADCAKNFDILSPHYYNGLLADHPPDYRDDPRRYEEFLKTRGDLIARSANPAIKIYVSEWNLTYGRWGNDWRVGLYAGGILNAFERQGDLVKMSCPALFMRKIGVTTSWDNALINFDQKAWFPAGNYVVMKLWREAWGPDLLALDGPDKPLNVVAVRSEDQKSLFLKVVNPEASATDVSVSVEGFIPAEASFQVIAPGAENVKNSLARPDLIKAVPGQAALSGKTVRFTMPAWSAGVVRVSR